MRDLAIDFTKYLAPVAAPVTALVTQKVGEAQAAISETGAVIEDAAKKAAIYTVVRDAITVGLLGVIAHQVWQLNKKHKGGAA
jgi:hypothetical protein